MPAGVDQKRFVLFPMIKITVLSYNNETTPAPLFAVFGPQGGTLGRGDDNIFVLPDPKRYVSRVQASVKSDGSRHTITNLSHANPIFINGEEIGSDTEHNLKPGDKIQIGLYLLRADPGNGNEADDMDQITVHAASLRKQPAQAQPQPQPQPITQPVHSRQPPSQQDPLNLGLSGGKDDGSDPFADLLGTPVQPVAPLVQAAPSPATAPAAPAPVNGKQPLSIDFDDLLVGLPGTSDAAPPSSAPDGKSNPGVAFDNPLAAGPSGAGERARTEAPKHDGLPSFDDLLSDSTHRTSFPDRHAALIPEDFDPFAMPSDTQRNSADPLGGLLGEEVTLDKLDGKKGNLDDLLSSSPDLMGSSLLDGPALGGNASSSVDPLALFANDDVMPKEQDGLLGDVVSDHVPEINAHFTLPEARAASDDKQLGAKRSADANDPFAFLAAPADVAPKEVASKEKAVEQVQAPIRQPQVVEPRVESRKTPVASNAGAAASVPPPQPADNQKLIEAFCRGVGISPNEIEHGMTPEFMEMIGELLSAAVQGTVELMASRALVKREVNADLTMIVVKNNNPLKFLPDGQTVLMQMLRKKLPGFMAPVEAMNDAYEDLRAHQIGVVAGMRAAMDEVLKRFNPKLLENRLKQRSFLDSVLPANRKAKMWDLYTELFEEIYIEAQDDFHTIFGKAFVNAYESEIERFKQGAQDD